jgi:hypothetical protein
MWKITTLRKMYPVERKLAERCNAIEKELNGLKRLKELVHEAEFSARALANMNNPEMGIGINTWTGEIADIGKITDTNQLSTPHSILFPPVPVGH